MMNTIAKVADMPKVVLIQEAAWKWVADGRGGNLRQQDIVVEQDQRCNVGDKSNKDHGRSKKPVLEVCGSEARRSRDGYL
jgi:hypothetical protein